MKLKAKYNKGHYKTTDSWLTAVYHNNKDYIDSRLIVTGKETPVKVFKQIVGEYIEEGLSPTKALKAVERSTIFTPKRDRLVHNAYEAIKADKEVYKRFRELTKTSKGTYSKVDLGKFVWDRQQGVYIYDNKLVISFRNSPYGIDINKIVE